jgi:hypothetical protein
MRIADLNPVLRSRLKHLIGRRKSYLYERDDMGHGKRHALLHGINQDIVEVIDRSLVVIGVRPDQKRSKGYRIRKAVPHPTRHDDAGPAA